jgi:DNA-binding IclR family transcriptional regulator
LEAVANSPAPMTARGVAESIGLDRITCYRMLKTIEEAGYLNFDTVSKTFSLSQRVLMLARNAMAQDADREQIDRILRAISAATGETCHYSEMDGPQTILTQRAKGTQLVVVDFQIGARCELHASSVGKAILASQDDSFIENYLDGELKRYTTNTFCEPERLRGEILKIRREGVAYDFEELSIGMNCVAVPFRGFSGEVRSGISISGPDSRFTAARLVELAAVIKDEIGKMKMV